MEIELQQKTALVAANRFYSYAQLWGLADLMATSFPEAGQKVAICSENSAAWLLALYGGWRHENIIVPMDYLSTPEELAYMLDDCQPAMLCHSDKTATVVQKALELSKHRCTLFNLDQFSQPEDVLASTKLQRNNDDIALILYTSGTTGSPKGVVLSFGNLQSNIDAVCGRPIIALNGDRVMGVPIFSTDTRCLILLPLHHILPLLGTAVMPLYNGGSIYICPSLSGDAIRDIMCTYHITHMVGVPRLYAVICKGIKDIVMGHAATRAIYKLAKYVDSLAFSRLVFKAVQAKFGGCMQYCVCGGAALDPEIARDLRVFGFEILEGYGMTEASPMIAFTHPNGTRIGTAGQMVPGVEVCTIDGELCARGANIMQGYYQRPEETAAVLTDGWLHTGDLGTISEDGFVTITGRCKEILVLNNGKNINPAEIESKLELLGQGIKEAAVLLVHGQLHALLVPENTAVTDFNAPINQYNQTVSPAKKIMGYTVCNAEIPRTRMGKIQRYKLNELLESQQKETCTPADIQDPDTYSPTARAVINYLNNMTGITVNPSQHLELDLGLDSLDKITLLSFIEHTFGLTCQEQNINSLSTIAELIDYIEKNKTKIDTVEENWQEILNENIKLKLPKSGFIHNILTTAASLTAKFCFRFKLSGRENLPQKPVIIAANHQSYADGLFISLLMTRRTFKKTLFLAKQKHFDSKLGQFLARHCNIIVMDINTNIKESMQKMAQALKQGNNVVIFPEGTRSLDGHLANFKRSFAIVSSELHVPVVPAVIKGAEKALPKGRIIPKIFSNISVSFLPPMESNDKDYQQLTTSVQEEIAAELQKAA